MNIFSKLFKGRFDKNFRSFNLWGTPNFRGRIPLEEKVAIVLSNPAMLKVFALQCDLFSLGKFYLYKGEQEIEEDKILDLLNEPNPFQSSQEFLWEYMFWQMLGLSQIFIYKKDLDSLLIPNKMYLLVPYQLDFPEEINDSKGKIILTDKTLRQIDDKFVTYNYPDGTNFKFKYGNLVSIKDLSTPNLGSDIDSRIDALTKVITNNEESLNSQNINIRFAGKFMVAGKSDPNNVNELPLSNAEKLDIEEKSLRSSPVEAVKSMIDIKRFVENAGNQKLDEAFLNTYFFIGTMYGIPRDVLEAYNSSTYENQEKARGAHVDYSLRPKGDVLAGKLSKFFGLYEKGLQIELDWDHLPFTQVFEEQRAKVRQTKAQTLTTLLRAGVPIEEVNEFLDTTFTVDESKQNFENVTQNQSD